MNVAKLGSQLLITPNEHKNNIKRFLYLNILQDSCGFLKEFTNFLLCAPDLQRDNRGSLILLFVLKSIFDREKIMYGKKMVIILLLMFSSLSCTKINDSNLNKIKEISPLSDSKLCVDMKSLHDAIDIAIPALYNDKMAQSFDSKLYVLTSVQQIIINNKWIWRVTFKPKELLPDDLSKGILGMGGEVFVNVDLSTKETVITYGE